MSRDLIRPPSLGEKEERKEEIKEEKKEEKRRAGRKEEE